MHDTIRQADLCQYMIRAVAVRLSPYMICERLFASNGLELCVRTCSKWEWAARQHTAEWLGDNAYAWA